MNRRETLDAAAACVLKDRSNAYGPPEQSFRTISELWSVILKPVLKEGHSIDPVQVALCMIGLKMARIMANTAEPHEDSVTDIVGYGACLGELSAKLGEKP